MKRRIRLTEGDLHRIVRETIQNVISEAGDYYWKQSPKVGDNSGDWEGHSKNKGHSKNS